MACPSANTVKHCFHADDRPVVEAWAQGWLVLRSGQERLVQPIGGLRLGHGDLTVIHLPMEAAARQILIQQREAAICVRRRVRGCRRRIRHGDGLRRRRRNGAGARILPGCRQRQGRYRMTAALVVRLQHQSAVDLRSRQGDVISPERLTIEFVGDCLVLRQPRDVHGLCSDDHYVLRLSVDNRRREIARQPDL